MLRNRLSPSRRFTYGMFIVSVQANKGMKVYEGRETSAILFIIIHERNSRIIGLACTTGALLAKKRGEHDISRVFVSLGSESACYAG